MIRKLMRLTTLNTTLNYETVEIDWPLSREELISPDKFLLRKLLIDFEKIQEEVQELRECCNDNREKNEIVATEMKIDTELTTDEERLYKTLRNRPAKHKRTQAESDLDIQFCLWYLRDAGIDYKLKKNVVGKTKCGIGSSRFSEYTKRKKNAVEHLIPLDYIPSNEVRRKQKRPRDPEGPSGVNDEKYSADNENPNVWSTKDGVRTSKRKKKVPQKAQEKNYVPPTKPQTENMGSSAESGESIKKKFEREHPGAAIIAYRNKSREESTFGVGNVVKPEDCLDDQKDPKVTFTHPSLKKPRDVCEEPNL